MYEDREERQKKNRHTIMTITFPLFVDLLHCSSKWWWQDPNWNYGAPNALLPLPLLQYPTPICIDEVNYWNTSSWGLHTSCTRISSCVFSQVYNLQLAQTSIFTLHFSCSSFLLLISTKPNLLLNSSGRWATTGSVSITKTPTIYHPITFWLLPVDSMVHSCPHSLGAICQTQETNCVGVLRQPNLIAL